MRDERYLPFEGSGAISTWRLDLPKETNTFDLLSVSDVLLRLQFTARQGVAARPVALQGRDAGAEAPAPSGTGPWKGLVRLVSLRREFPDALAQLLRPAGSDPTQASFEFTQDLLPRMVARKSVTLKGWDVVVRLTDALLASSSPAWGSADFLLTPPQPASPGSTPGAAITVASGGPLNGLPYGANESITGASFGTWRIAVPDASFGSLGSAVKLSVSDGAGGTRIRLNPAAIEDIYLVCRYDAK